MRDFFYLTDLQPGFSIGDETRLEILRKESLDQVFERRFEEDNEAFCAFLRSYSAERNDNRLKEHVMKVYKEMLSIPHYFEWAKDRTQIMGGEHPLTDLGVSRFIVKETTDALQDAAKYGTIRRLATLTARASRQTEKYDCGGSQRKYP